MLARAVSHSHKVLLTGEGADEIFLGYSRIFRLPFDLRRQELLAALPDIMAARPDVISAFPSSKQANLRSSLRATLTFPKPRS
ncbi:hypothetical protein IVB44_34870 [Bradyrhizobium sp. 49]|nr:hypothetical protein [Bradyrhizobium sp. 84]MCK1376056.1 hypothetical protein [Bradyrhizobium sp. 49]